MSVCCNHPLPRKLSSTSQTLELQDLSLAGIHLRLSRDAVRSVGAVAVVAVVTHVAQRQGAAVVGHGLRLGILQHGVQHQGRVWFGHSPECPRTGELRALENCSGSFKTFQWELGRPWNFFILSILHTVDSLIISQLKTIIPWARVVTNRSCSTGFESQRRRKFFCISFRETRLSLDILLFSLFVFPDQLAKTTLILLSFFSLLSVWK